MNSSVNHEEEYREEENRRRYEQKNIYWVDPRDPNYISPEEEEK